MEAAAEEYNPTEETFHEFALAYEQVGETHALRAPGVWLNIPYEQETWLMACALRPDLIERYLDVQMEESLKSLEILVPMGGRMFFGGRGLCI